MVEGMRERQMRSSRDFYGMPLKKDGLYTHATKKL